MDSKEKKILGLTAAAHSNVHFYEGVLPPLIPLLLSEFNTDYFHLGIVVSVFSYAFGFGSFPAGFLADRIGPLLLVSFYLFGAGLLSLFILPVNGIVSYGILMGLLGLFCSTYHPGSNTLLARAIKERGKAFGIHGIAGSLGVAAAPLLSAWAGSVMGWKAPHLIFGFLGLVIGFYSLTLYKQMKAGGGYSGKKVADAGQVGFSYLNLVLFFLSVTALGLTYKGIMTFLPAYMGENVHIQYMSLDKVTLGGTIATLVLCSGAVGQYLAGRMADRYKPEAIYFGAIAMGTLFVFAMAFSTEILLVFSAVLYAFFYFSTQPIQNYLISRYMPPHRQGFGFGLHFSLNFGVGSTAAAFSGYLADQFGLTSVFYVMGACFFLSACAASLLLMRIKGGLRMALPGDNRR